MQPLLFLFVFTFILPHMAGAIRWRLGRDRASAPSFCLD